jgi:hypothetical protein
MLTITVYQASGEVSTYVQHDTEVAAQILDRLNPARLFTENRILIGSPSGLGIYNGHRISRLDVEADQTLATLLPAPQPGPVATVMDNALWEEEFRNPDAPADYGIPQGELFTLGIQIGLLGKHRISARITAELIAPMERINAISNVLNRPFIRLNTRRQFAV